MNFNNLHISSWNELNETGSYVLGYYGLYLSKSDDEKSNLLIFKDEDKKLHFVVADDLVTQKDIPDPRIKGLAVKLKKYKFQDAGIKQFIDIECSLNAYINEFTEVVKEIAEKILIQEKLPVIAFSDTINNWRSFWSTQIRQELSEEKQIGLICELKVLKRLCEINPNSALNSWKGPLKEKYDYIFSEWVFEVKGTSKGAHTHIINGLDQLKTPSGKNLAFISFLVTKIESAQAKSLQNWIDDIELNSLQNKVVLIEHFHKLLSNYGYSRIHKEEYEKNKYDIFDGMFYIVNSHFPRLTTEYLKHSLDNRVSDVQYVIDLNGLFGDSFNDISIGKYAY